MMKYLSYFFIAIVSAFLFILLSLLSCSPNPQSSVIESSTQSPASHQAQPLVSPQTATATVKIHNFKFEPANVTISEDESVQFINLDEEPHTATSTDRTFDSKALDTNQTWNHTVTKSGTFPYICSVHPFMKGTVTVTPKKT
jgi:plastocyanin